MKRLKNAKGITVIALIITVIILLILAGISLNLVIGENGIIEKSKLAGRISTIEGIRESLQMEVARSYDDDATLDVQKLKNNIMEDYPEAKIIGNEFPIIVIIKEYAYEIDENGKVEYIGKENELISKTKIEASPTENTTPELVQKVNVTVKTKIAMENDDITLVYAWSNNENTKPEDNKYIKAQLAGDAKNKTAQIASNDTEEGNYYLWIKAIIGEKEVEKKYGPYAIKDHTTLTSCADENDSSSVFLKGTITRNQIESVTIGTSLEGHTVSEENCWDVSSDKSEKYLAWYEDKDSDGYYEVTIAGEGGIVANSNSSNLFRYVGYNGDDTTVFYGLENLNTELVTDISNMFNCCKNATSIDVRSFNTKNVTNMESLFYNCQNVTSLYIDNLYTNNVISMAHMFGKCQNIVNLDLNSFNTSNVTNMLSMFYGCSSLTDIDVSEFDTSNVNNISYMFRECRNIASLDISNFNTSNVTSMTNMFAYCDNLINLNVRNIDTNRVTTMSEMFLGCSKLTNLDISNFNTSNVTKMYGMFSYCNNITELNLSNLDTSKVTNMFSMFNGCVGLTNLNVDNFVTNNVKNMSFMFNGCSNLINIDLSNFDTSNVTDMSYMFNYSSNLMSIKLDNFDTSKVTNMECMFRNCRKVTDLNINKFNTNNVSNWTNMFSSVSSNIKIKTNSDTATWLKEKFTNITDANIELVS